MKTEYVFDMLDIARACGDSVRRHLGLVGAGDIHAEFYFEPKVLDELGLTEDQALQLMASVQLRCTPADATERAPEGDPTCPTNVH